MVKESEPFMKPKEGSMARERCLMCGTPLDANREGYIEDPELPAQCPGCGAELPCLPLEVPGENFDPFDLPAIARTKLKYKRHAKKKKSMPKEKRM
jgi:NAD-dependent SIR2 family protein deacetylase